MPERREKLTQHWRTDRGRVSISQTIYYKWRDKFLEGGKTALVSNGAPVGVEAEKAKIAELERVIGQQAVEIQVLKKNLKLR